jgi:hypothetical protein
LVDVESRAGTGGAGLSEALFSEDMMTGAAESFSDLDTWTGAVDGVRGDMELECGWAVKGTRDNGFDAVTEEVLIELSVSDGVVGLNSWLDTLFLRYWSV